MKTYNVAIDIHVETDLEYFQLELLIGKVLEKAGFTDFEIEAEEEI